MEQIQLTEEVMVSDPCYTVGTWCQTKLGNVLPGKYNWSVGYTDEGSWGTRVANVMVLHESYDDDDSIDWEDHSEVGVDSGQCGIFSMTSYRNDEIAEGITTPPTDFDLPFDEEGDKWYEKMCKFTLSKDQYGKYDTGVVTSSGLGDGMYPVEVAYDNDKVIGIRITYLDNSDEEILGDCCGVCGEELNEDGTCDFCNEEENQD